MAQGGVSMETMLKRIACYARDEENHLRQEYPEFAPLVVVELDPSGVTVRCGAWRDEEAYSVNGSVSWDAFDERSVGNVINDCTDGMRAVLSKER